MAKVLVVDDDKQICDSIKDILESVGHEVTSASDGAEAISILEKGRFNLALLDIMMPKIDGYHLATHISGMPDPPPIIFVSGRDCDQEQKIVESLGAAAYIQKPFEKKELVKVVSDVLAMETPS